jgi:hypothetical protein
MECTEPTLKPAAPACPSLPVLLWYPSGNFDFIRELLCEFSPPARMSLEQMEELKKNCKEGKGCSGAVEKEVRNVQEQAELPQTTNSFHSFIKKALVTSYAKLTTTAAQLAISQTKLIGPSNQSKDPWGADCEGFPMMASQSLMGIAATGFLTEFYPYNSKNGSQTEP